MADRAVAWPGIGSEKTSGCAEEIALVCHHSDLSYPRFSGNVLLPHPSIR